MSYFSFSDKYCYGCFWKYPLENPNPFHQYTRAEETQIFKSVREQSYLCDKCYKKCDVDLPRICTKCETKCELTLQQKQLWTHSELFDSLYDYECEECWNESLK